MAFEAGIAAQGTKGRVYGIGGAALVVEEGPRVPVGEAGPDALYLGTLDGEPCFARLIGEGDPLPPGARLVPLRQLFGALPDADFAVAARALGLTAWDRDHRHCGRCGAPTARSETERVRVCTRCGHHSWPRLSPAIIALVERDGRALLARNARTRMPFHTTLAGFVEVGETLEEAVAREIREEAGIEVKDVRYFGSQPWPFTGALMVGFTARWAGGEIRQDESEIVDAGWFAPDALPALPPPLSIARALIDDFVRCAQGSL
jgi:NAD+ diphosphatase